MTVEASVIMDRLDSTYASLGACGWAYDSDPGGGVDVYDTCDDTYQTWHMRNLLNHRAWWWGNYYDSPGADVTIEFY
jgi:hypothetical protein